MTLKRLTIAEQTWLIEGVALDIRSGRPDNALRRLAVYAASMQNGPLREQVESYVAAATA